MFTYSLNDHSMRISTSFSILIALIHTTFLHEGIDVFTLCLAIGLCYLVLSLCNKFSAQFLEKRPQILRLILYLTSIFHHYLIFKALTRYGMCVFKAVMLLVSTALLFQALSINFDHNRVMRKANLTVLDLNVLLFTVVAFYKSIQHGCNYLLACHIVIWIAIIAILALCLRSKRLLPSLLAPLIVYLLDSCERPLYIAFLCTPFVSYLHGYIEAFNCVPTLDLCYNNNSILLLLLSALIVSTLHTASLCIS